MTTSSKPTGEGNSRAAAWAKPVDRLKVSGAPAEAININVEGRQLTGPLRGFGQMWQKTYKVRLSGAQVTPANVIKVWKENFHEFWPKGAHFYAPLTGIAPGEIALLNLSGPGDMPMISTGVMVIYADDESFTFMTPEGHMLAGWITFCAYEEEGCTVAQAQALVRANDPVYEIGMRLAGYKEDEFWQHTLAALAAHFGVQGQVSTQAACVDPKVQWSEAKNIWQNAGLRTALYTLAAPLRWVGQLLKR